MKIETLIERLNKKSDKQLQLYTCNYMKLNKEDLIWFLEEDEEIKIDRKLTYLQIVNQYREDVITLIVELLESCD